MFDFKILIIVFWSLTKQSNKEWWFGLRFSELLVGAPFHTVKKDEGRVYVYMNNGQVSKIKYQN